jgi:four helix bundle protein
MSAELRDRTKRFAIEIIAEVGEFPNSPRYWVLGKQMLRSGTAVGALYREAERAESRDDFVHKLGIASKEAAEACYWLELLTESGLAKSGRSARLLTESRELMAILIASGRTARGDRPRTKS